MSNKPCDHRCLIRLSIKEFFICKNSSFVSKSNKCILKSPNLYNSDYFSTLINNTLTDHQLILQNKTEYLEYLAVRKNAVVLLKNLSSSFSLCDRTFHLSVLLLDRIYSKINSFNEINIISVFCLILAAKFAEDDACKASLLQKKYSHSLSSNYQSDEIYLLKLLDYNLTTSTAYDILSYMVSIGIVSNDELKICTKQTVDSIEHICLSYLNNLIQYNFVVPLSPLQIALGVIQICRKKIGLATYTNELVNKFELSNKDNLFKEGYSTFAKVLMKKRSKHSKIKEEESKSSSDHSLIVL